MSKVVNTKKTDNRLKVAVDLNVDELNKHFIDSSNLNEDNPVIIDNDINILTDKIFSLPETNEEEVGNELTKLNARKATGIDCIPSKILKISALLMAPLLAFLINLCFSTSKVPEIWKTARITPLFKSGDKKVFNNYRPISVLPIMNKIMEKLVYKSLLKYLTNNKLL